MGDRTLGHRATTDVRRSPRACRVNSTSHGDIEVFSLSRGGRVWLVAYHKWTRFCLAARGWEFDLFRALESQLEEGVVGRFVDQVKRAQQGHAGEAVPLDADFARGYPATWEFVSLTKVDEKTTRETATLLFFLDAGVWKVCLHDRDSGLSLWAAGESFLEALEALETCLQSPNPQWREGKKRTPRKP